MYTIYTEVFNVKYRVTYYGNRLERWSFLGTTFNFYEVVLLLFIFMGYCFFWHILYGERYSYRGGNFAPVQRHEPLPFLSLVILILVSWEYFGVKYDVHYHWTSIYVCLATSWKTSPVRDFLAALKHIGGLWLLSAQWSGCCLFDTFPISILKL